MTKNEYSLRLLARAAADIGDIYQYIAEVLLNSKAADDLLKEFEKGFARVLDHPQCCPFDKTEQDYRALIVKNYIAFYRIEGSEILVYRVLYGMSDYRHSI